MPYQEITRLYFLQVPGLDKHPIQIPNHLVQLVVSQSNMDIRSLDDALQSYYSAALATSTHKTAERKYVAFCEKFRVKLPSNENNLCYFVTWLGREGLQHSTMRTYLSGVHQIQIAHGFPDPKFDNMSKTLPDITRSQDCCGPARAFKM